MRASTGMTAALGVAIVLGGAGAVFSAQSARGTALRAEHAPSVASPAPEPRTQEAPAPDSGGLNGTVLETLAVSNYTYLRLSTPKGEVWAAVPRASLSVGSRVAIDSPTPMENFESATLKRTFPVIYFGTGAGAGAIANSAFSPADILNEDEQDLPAGHPAIDRASGPELGDDGSRALPAGHPDIGSASAQAGSVAPSSNPAEPSLPALNIARAQGEHAHDIAELRARQQALVGQRVRVRGQVTKVTPHVQGHTFFHLRDGNLESDEPKTDLVVTSSAEPARGQVATFEGTLRANVDVGIGFNYPLLLENAVLVSE